MGYSLAEFLAHAVALEQEAAERYLELADMMETHNNLETAAVFRDMAKFSTLHGDEIKARAAGVTLPALKSWQYRWKSPPEVGDDDGVSYLMTAYHALRYARDNEIRGMMYYSEAAASSEDPEVQRLGKEFAEEEGDHVKALDKWIERTPRSDEDYGDEDEAQGLD